MAGLIGSGRLRFPSLWSPVLRAAPAWLGRFAFLLGDEPAPGERPADLLLAVSPETGAVSVHDRRGENPAAPIAVPDTPDALAEVLASLRGAGRAFSAARLLLPPSACFVRVLPFPAGALPRMRQLLALELEASTPFKADGVLSDWYVESHDPDGGTLQVRHVVVSRARVAPLLGALAAAGIPLRSVLVGASETALVPVDLLSDGHHPLPSLIRRIRPLDAALVAGAILVLLAAYGTLRSRQESVLADLDGQTAAARSRTARPAPGLPPAATALLAPLRGTPSVAATLDAVAAALPDSVHADTLDLDETGLTLVVRSREPLEVLGPLPRVAGFGQARLAAAETGPDGWRTTLAMPFAAPGGAPTP